MFKVVCVFECNIQLPSAFPKNTFIFKVVQFSETQNWQILLPAILAGNFLFLRANFDASFTFDFIQLLSRYPFFLATLYIH